MSIFLFLTAMITVNKSSDKPHKAATGPAGPLFNAIERQCVPNNSRILLKNPRIKQ